jgi:YD repeat-containing protein
MEEQRDEPRLNKLMQQSRLGQHTGGWLCSGSSAAACSGGTEGYGYTISIAGGRVNTACDSALGPCTTIGYDDLNRMQSRTTASGTTYNANWTYDRYGNRWAQNANGGSPQLTFNAANNQAVGFNYDAAGNMLTDGVHQYTYDAEGNITQVDAGSTTINVYDALNHRVEYRETGSASNGAISDVVFDPDGRRIVLWDVTSYASKSSVYWGSHPIAIWDGNLHFQQQDWVGTDRGVSTSTGTIEGAYFSLPYGDDFIVEGYNPDASLCRT